MKDYFGRKWRRLIGKEPNEGVLFVLRYAQSLLSQEELEEFVVHSSYDNRDYGFLELALLEHSSSRVICTLPEALEQTNELIDWYRASERGSGEKLQLLRKFSRFLRIEYPWDRHVIAAAYFLGMLLSILVNLIFLLVKIR